MIKFGRIRRVKVPPQVNRNQDLGNDSRPAQFLTILASSVGGSADLIRLIPSLPAELPSAVIAVHDMQQEALPAFIDYLERRSRIKVQPLKPGHWLSQGVCYIHPATVTYRTRKRAEPHSCRNPWGTSIFDVGCSASLGIQDFESKSIVRFAVRGFRAGN